MLNKSKYILYLRFFKVATLCLDDSFAHSWYSLIQLHLESFSNSLEGVPTYAEHLLAAFPSLHAPTHPQPISIWLRSGVLLGQIALTQLGGVLGHCPVAKQMIVPLSANQMRWRIAAECCGSHAG